MNKLKCVLLFLGLTFSIFGQKLDFSVTSIVIDNDTVSTKYVNDYDFKFKIDLELDLQIFTVFRKGKLFYSSKEKIYDIQVTDFVLTYKTNNGSLYQIPIREHTEIITGDIHWIGNLTINFKN